jgi:hypothetical protein
VGRSASFANRLDFPTNRRRNRFACFPEIFHPVDGRSFLEKITMSRTFLRALVVLVTLGTTAKAQLITAGSTPAGDYLRGVGIAAQGMGIYNESTARANQINAETEIRVSDYIREIIRLDTRARAARRAYWQAKDREAFEAIQKRILESPEERDVMNGDSLNATLDKLMDPKIQESSFRYAKVDLSVDDIRRIPFKLAEKNEKFSMSRLSPKGKGKWPVAFQDDAFALERRGYERALDNALEQAIEGKVSQKALKDLEDAVDNLRRKLDQVVGPSRERDYLEARKQLDELGATPRLLRTHTVEQALGEIDKYSGTTVNDLRLFMQKYNLRFAAADTPDERKLYPGLYAAALVQQREKVTAGIQEPGK